jgi:hypothetical protein
MYPTAGFRKTIDEIGASNAPKNCHEHEAIGTAPERGRRCEPGSDKEHKSGTDRATGTDPDESGIREGVTKESLKGGACKCKSAACE